MLASATNGGATPTQGSDSNGGNGVVNSVSSLEIPGLNVPAATNTSPSRATGGSGGGSPLSITAIALISVAGAGVLFFALLIGYCCWWRNSFRQKRNVVNPSQPPQLKVARTAASQVSGPASIVSWNRQTPPGANPNVPPSHKSASEYGDSGPAVNQSVRPMSTLHEQQSQRNFG